MNGQQLLTKSQFLNLLQRAGWPRDQWSMALATAEVESGLQPGAVNPQSGATGLFQILPGHVGEPGITAPLTDALTNVKDALVLWTRAGGTFARDWWQWEPPGAVQQYLPSAQEALSQYPVDTTRGLVISPRQARHAVQLVDGQCADPLTWQGGAFLQPVGQPLVDSLNALITSIPGSSDKCRAPMPTVSAMLPGLLVIAAIVILFKFLK